MWSSSFPKCFDSTKFLTYSVSLSSSGERPEPASPAHLSSPAHCHPAQTAGFFSVILIQVKLGLLSAGGSGEMKQNWIIIGRRFIDQPRIVRDAGERVSCAQCCVRVWVGLYIQHCGGFRMALIKEPLRNSPHFHKWDGMSSEGALISLQSHKAIPGS